MTTEIEKRETEPLARISPDVDLIDHGSSYELRADMPGVAAGDLSVNTEDYVLHLSGVARSSSPEGFRAARREFGDCEYGISYRLSQEIDLDAIQARISNGVLSVELPKREKKGSRKIEVETA